MYKSSLVFTLSVLAPHFGLSDDELGDLAYSNLDIEDGLMWITSAQVHEEIGLIFEGIENIAELLAELGNEKAVSILSKVHNRTFCPKDDPQ